MSITRILLALMSASSICHAIPFPSQQNITRYLFITGDSYTATGFNITLRPQPSDRHPLGNPAYPGVTFSGGENWVDVAVFNESRNSTLRLARGTVAYNFAVGSNTVNISETQLSNASAPHPITDMIDQVNEIEAVFTNQSRYHYINSNSDNTMFISWFGINDIFYNGIFSDRNYTQATHYLRADIRDYFKQLERLYGLGARKFLNILVPPLQRVPVVMALGKEQMGKNLTRFWNNELQRQNVDFLNKLTDAQSYIYDPRPIFNKILDNPKLFGAPDNVCEDPVHGYPCLWHDFIHPGIEIQTHLGEEIYQHIKRTGFFNP